MPGTFEVAPHASRPIPPTGVLALYAEERWWPHRSAADVEQLLAGSSAVGAWAGGSLVGFARAVTDGSQRAYVEDVIVAGGHRGRGIGGALLDAVLDDLAAVATVSLFASRALADFYRARGFISTSQVVLHRDRTDGEDRGRR